MADGTSCGAHGIQVCVGGVCQNKSCQNDADCPGETNECQRPVCNQTSLFCEIAYESIETPRLHQTPGDCQKEFCGGANGTNYLADDTDRPADWNANPCAPLVCSEGEAIPDYKPAGTSCGPGKVCNGAGVCQ